MKITN